MKASFKGQLQDLKDLQKAHQKDQKKREAEKLKAQKKAAAAAKAAASPAKVQLSDADKRAFLASVRGVERISDDNRVEHTPKPQAQQEYFRKKRLQAEGEQSVDTRFARKPAAKTRSPKIESYNRDEGTYVRDLHAADLLKRLRQGQWMVEATLDLHGCKETEASKRFDRFISTCIEHDVKCVCVVHGQGHGSKNNEAVLRDAVDRWLKNIPQIAAFMRSPVGGEGATIALISAAQNE